MYTIICKQYPSGSYIGQTGQALHKRISGHKFGIRIQSKEEVILVHCNFPGHCIVDFKVTILEKWDF